MAEMKAVRHDMTDTERYALVDTLMEKFGVSDPGMYFKVYLLL